MPAVRHIREGNLFCSQAGRNTWAGMPGHGTPGSGHCMHGAGNGTPARAEPGLFGAEARTTGAGRW